MKSGNTEIQEPSSIPKTGTSGGPYLVTGGPGSGKTRLLVRVASRVLASGIPVDRLLVLTHSNRNAAVISQLLASSLPSAYTQLQVYDFAALGKRLLRDHYYLLNIRPNFQVLTDFERKIVLRHLLWRPRFRLKHFGRVQKTTGFLEEAGDTLDSIKQAGVKQNLTRTQSGKDLALLYDDYEQFLTKNNYLDFRDLTLKTVELLSRNKSLLDDLRQKLTWLLMDEFEDMDRNEYEILRLLGAGRRGILICLGEEEGIYRFRGADTQRNVQRLHSDFHVVEKKLRVRRAPEQRELLRVRNRAQEMRAVAKTLMKWKRKSPQSRWSEMAVITRGLDSDIGELKEVLWGYKIPSEILGGAGFFRQPEIASLLSVLHIIWSSSTAQDVDDDKVARALATCDYKTGKPWLSEVEIERLCSRALRNNRSLWSEIREQLLERKDKHSGASDSPYISQETKRCLRKFLSQVQKIRQHIGRMTVEQIVYEVLWEFGFLNNVTKSLKQDYIAASKTARNVRYFYDVASRFARLIGQVSGGIPDFNEFMLQLNELVNSYGREIMVTFSNCQDSVQILTVHQAKGLFFKNVIMLDMVEGVFPREFREPSILSLGEYRQLNILPEPDRQEYYHQETRMFEVASSRAIDRIVFLAPESDPRGTTQTLSRPVSSLCERFPCIERQTNEECLSPDELMSVHEALQYAASRNVLDDLREVLPSIYVPHIKKSTGSQILNVRDYVPYITPSMLNTYQECPQKFYHEYILRIEAPPDGAAIAGTLIHGILKELHIMYPGAFDRHAVEAAMEITEHIWKDKSNEFPTKYESQYWYQRVRNQLSVYLEYEKTRQRDVRECEYSISFNLGDIPLKCRLDRIDALPGGGIEIIDYKSGKFSWKTPKTVLAHGANDLLQLPAYFWALKESNTEYKDVQKITFWALKNEKPVTVDITEDTLDELRRQRDILKKLCLKIFSGDFSVSEKKQCWGCPYQNICPEALR